MPNDKHLFIAPHIDDEIIGCGGLILKLLSLQKKVKVVVVFGNSISKEETLIRRQEAEDISKYLGIEYIILDFEERKTIHFDVMVNELLKVILDFYPDSIYYPHSKESDFDHSLVNDVTNRACFLAENYSRGIKSNVISKRYLYEVWTPLEEFNFHINITNFIGEKKKLIAKYKSQQRNSNLINGTEGLNAYRGMQVGVDFAEVYKLKGY
ncbi:PIG-L deacetylase family protein [Paramaledivibacter caminithermalis]|jgi:LmbE family N-acetylglucosaminyl deacetylase|uniref:N-acetylglucosaminyl deacetylase, LmbE family n=1 Tax=Paramaledivibacter caminithermalis (strain DSM 15212 / CIP 107654 / DViRD3) TaxID=1121301 RepID=A0A1M6R031_PARC5|nr:PIG-L family deacetylase [Paramaledivibacter caminithermalis]SHK25736.1 N-acetylglucosaminyl deacetylase, LmbE family [Paramaledivibacter caminithermalis DSM 15212]